jgi:four helix bundle protein
MALQVTEVGFEMVAAVRPVVARIRQRDRSLADQLVRAASSVVLNIAEAKGRMPETGELASTRRREARMSRSLR